MNALFAGVLGNPWTLVVAAALAFGSGYYTSHEFDKAGYASALEKKLSDQKTNFEEAAATHNEQQGNDQRLSAENAKLRDDLSGARDQLLKVTLVQPLTTKEITTVDTPCPPVRRNPKFRQCFNAAISGEASSIDECSKMDSELK